MDARIPYLRIILVPFIGEGRTKKGQLRNDKKLTVSVPSCEQVAAKGEVRRHVDIGPSYYGDVRGGLGGFTGSAPYGQTRNRCPLGCRGSVSGTNLSVRLTRLPTSRISPPETP